MVLLLQRWPIIVDGWPIVCDDGYYFMGVVEMSDKKMVHIHMEGGHVHRVMLTREQYDVLCVAWGGNSGRSMYLHTLDCTMFCDGYASGYSDAGDSGSLVLDVSSVVSVFVVGGGVA